MPHRPAIAGESPEGEAANLGGSAAESIDLNAHIGLVQWVIKRRGFARRAVGALTHEDLMQEGLAGLVRATHTFDPTKGAWSTYATQWVRQHVSRHIQDRGCTVRVPVHAQEARRKAGERTLPVVRRLDVPISADSEATLADLIFDPDEPTPEDLADARSAAARLEKLYHDAQLTARERLVLRMRANESTLDEVGECIRLTRERARQIESNALGKLRRAAGVPADAPRVALGMSKARNGTGFNRCKPRVVSAGAQP
jgi:RNA polymerase sigma factor (sigma-70 family)